MRPTRQIIDVLLDRLAVGGPTGKAPPVLLPWFKGFRGKVELAPGGTSFLTSGIIDTQDADVGNVRISELPVGRWADDYKVGACVRCSVRRLCLIA